MVLPTTGSIRACGEVASHSNAREVYVPPPHRARHLSPIGLLWLHGEQDRQTLPVGHLVAAVDVPRLRAEDTENQ